MLLVAWRVKEILQPSVGAGTTRAVFIAFGLTSMIVAIPFLWRSLPWKRLLAYSSLEHMGIIALGIGFGTPLAIAGVVLHVAGHALAKALGFYATLPLLRIQPKAATHAPVAVLNDSPATATAMGVSLVALSGLPPSPLFLSELLILLGGLAAGRSARQRHRRSRHGARVPRSPARAHRGGHRGRSTPPQAPPVPRGAANHRAHRDPRHRDARVRLA